MIFMKIEEISSCPPVLQQSYYPSLDGFRGIAILNVLIGHSVGDFRLIHSGGFGVSIFFVISGFLITTLLLKEKERTGTISLRKFYIRRFLRIFPVAYLYLIVMVLFNFLFSLKIPVAAFLSAALYLQNTTMITDYILYVGHYWSLSVEEQFYLLFPFLLKRSGKLYLVIIAVALFFIPIISYSDLHHLWHNKVLHHIAEILGFMPGILIGALFAVLFYLNLLRISEVVTGKYKSFLCFLVFLLAGYCFNNHPMHLPTSGMQMFSNVLIALLILVSLQKDDSVFYRAVTNPYLIYIGTLSYSIYIWQQMFTLDGPPWKGMFFLSDSMVLNLILLGIISWVSYHFYEKNFLKLKTRFKV